MQDREKKLAIGLCVVLVVALVLPLLERWFLQPLTDARNKLLATQESLVELETDKGLLERARRNLDDWQYESLPPNPFTAQREYSEWLMDLARMSGFTTPEPTLGNVPTRGRTFIEIPVHIEAKATLQQLARFLYHFERVALLHQVQTLDVTSPASVGNPLLDVTIHARGLSLIDAPARSRLFPTTTLQEEVSTDDTVLAVESLQGFPLVDGFQVKVGEELMTVRQRSEHELTIERGAEETVAAPHPAGSFVELFPEDRERFVSGRTIEEYVDLMKNSPFTKPSPPIDYSPELSPTTPQTVTRGEPWTLSLKLDGWDPSGGPAIYSLEGSSPDGLRINEQSGELTWDPGPQVEVGTHDVQVLARSNIMSDQQARLTLLIRLREPNLPPTIEAVESLKAFSGRPLTVTIKADDPDGENEALKYSLGGEVPAGASIDKVGTVTWIPPLTLELGEYKLAIEVADSGDPQQKTTQEVKVQLEDDAALFTQLNGFFSADNKPEAMLRNLTSGKTSRLTKGDEVTAAEIKATIVGIEPDHIVLQVGEKQFRLDLGNNLRQMTPIESPDTPPAGDPPPTES